MKPEGVRGSEGHGDGGQEVRQRQVDDQDISLENKLYNNDAYSVEAQPQSKL